MADCLFAEGHCLVDDGVVPVVLAAVQVQVVLATRHSVEVHVCDSKVHGIELVGTRAQLLLQLLFHELAPLRPSAQTLRYYVVRETLEFAIGHLHLIVLRVENH